jgi:hypothetical protein
VDFAYYKNRRNHGFLSNLYILRSGHPGVKNSSVADIFWDPGFAITAWAAFLLTPDGLAARKLLLVVIVTLWGLRLSLHILTRNWGKPEDLPSLFFVFGEGRRVGGMRGVPCPPLKSFGRGQAKGFN